MLQLLALPLAAMPRTALQAATVVGSGLMAERLAGGNLALALLANTLATVFVLYVLIEVFGPVSGAHFNPAVSLVMACRRDLPRRWLAPYVAVQLGGAVAGVMLAHAMFAEPLLQTGTQPRRGAGLWLAEAGRHRRAAAGDPARPRRQGRSAGCRLHRCGLLVHRVDLVRQPGGRAHAQPQLRRHRPGRGAGVRRRPVRRRTAGPPGLHRALGPAAGAGAPARVPTTAERDPRPR